MESDNPTRAIQDVGPPGGRRADELLPLVYEQLRELARRRMTEERAGHTMQATALVHEAYMRLAGGGLSGTAWNSRAHFFHAAAEAMRRILIEHARAKGRLKRGGNPAGGGGVSPNPTPKRRVPLDLVELARDHDPSEMLDLDDAVCRLEGQSADLAAVVRLRFYAGLTIEETAEALGVSAQTVKRDWSYARAWLFRELGY